MKGIDDMLSQHTPKPKRELDVHFTQSIVAEIKNGEAEKPSPTRRLVRWIHTVPGIAVLLLMLAGGSFSTYALTTTLLNDTPTVTTSPSDPTVITINLNNCTMPWLGGHSYDFAVPGSPAYAQNYAPLGNGPIQFKLLHPSEYPASVIRTSILTECEEEGVDNLYRTMQPSAQEEPTTRDDIMSGKITNATSDSVTVQFTLDAQTDTITYPLTSSVPLYHDETHIDATALHAGDFATFVYQQHGDYDSPNWWPVTPTASNTTLLSLDQTQYDFTSSDATSSLGNGVMLLSAYNEQQAENAAMKFYEKNDPNWSLTHYPSNYSLADGTIVSIDAHQATITFASSPYDKTVNVSMPITNATTVYENGEPIPLSSLHAGDAVMAMVYQPNNDQGYHAYNPMSAGTTIVSITRVAQADAN